MKTKSFKSALFTTTALILAVGSIGALVARTAHADTTKQESAGELLDDSVITTKVKAAFFKDEKVSALRINVTSNKGVVQLSGFANSALESTRAAEIAGKVPGVKGVKNDILLK